jgi:two-component system, NtrC family, response regulator AlgB
MTIETPAGDPQPAGDSSRPAAVEPAASGSAPLAEASARPFKVLVIDDEREMRDALSISVRMLGCKVDAAETADAALARVRVDSYALAFCDLMLGDGNGIELVPKLLALNPNLQIIVVTGFATFETAVKAVKAGASDYLQKPFDPAQIRRIVELALDDHRQAEAFIHLERNAQKGLDGMVWNSRAPTMQTACSIIARAAQAAVPVLLRGESGTGKGLCPRARRAQIARAEQPFVTVNCPALTDELLTS